MPIFWQVEVGDYQKGLDFGSQTAFQSVGVIFGKDVVLPKSLGASKTPHRESMNISR